MRSSDEDGARGEIRSLAPAAARGPSPIVVCREDLDGLIQRLLWRLMIGGTCLLVSVAVALWVPTSTMPSARVVGASFAAGWAISLRGKRRLRDDLWETRLLEDAVVIGLPWIVLVLALAGVGAAPITLWKALWAAVIARLFPTVQEAAMLAMARDAMREKRASAARAVENPAPRIPASHAQPGRTRRTPPAASGLVIGTVETGEAPCCPVCSQQLAGETLRCSKCDTEHHVECFHYNGRCGRFACGGMAVAGS